MAAVAAAVVATAAVETAAVVADIEITINQNIPRRVQEVAKQPLFFI
jgi:hypothetical protein